MNSDRYEQYLAELKNPKNVRFRDLLKICTELFGECRVKGSHHVFKTPWRGDPRINLQEDGRKSKPYQVRQVVQAIRRLMENKGVAGNEEVGE